MKKILVIGSGGREHAVCEQFKKSSQDVKLFALPGNAGISEVAEIVDGIKISEHQKIIDFCKNEKIDLFVKECMLYENYENIFLDILS